MQRGTRRVARIASLVVAAAAFAVPLAATTPASAAGPTVTPSADDNLHGNQTVTVSGTGFAATVTVGIIECSSPTPSFANPNQDCDTTDATTTQTDAGGAFSGVHLKLASGAVGTSGHFCPSKTASGPCYLIAADTSNPTTDAAEHTLTFAPIISITPNKDVKSGQKVSVSGYGFQPSTKSYVTECANPPSGTSCNGKSNVTPTTSANGTLSNVKVTVTTGPWGNATKFCNAGGSCIITATTNLTPGTPDASAQSAFTFAKLVSKVKTQVFVNSPKVAHHKVKLTGVIESGSAGVAGLKVTAYERAKGTKKWHKAGTTKSHKNGVFSVKGLKHFSHKEQYKVSHKSQQVGSTIYLASSSKPRTLKK